MSTNNGPNEWIDKLYRVCCLLAVLSGYPLIIIALTGEWQYAAISVPALALSLAGIRWTGRKRRARDQLRDRFQKHL